MDRHRFDFIGASPDAVTTDGRLIEVKAPHSLSGRRSMKAGRVPLRHQLQLQMLLAVTGLKEALHVEHRPDDGDLPELVVASVVPRRDSWLEHFILPLAVPFSAELNIAKRTAPAEEPTWNRAFPDDRTCGPGRRFHHKIVKKSCFTFEEFERMSSSMKKQHRLADKLPELLEVNWMRKAMSRTKESPVNLAEFWTHSKSWRMAKKLRSGKLKQKLERVIQDRNLSLDLLSGPYLARQQRCHRARADGGKNHRKKTRASQTESFSSGRKACDCKATWDTWYFLETGVMLFEVNHLHNHMCTDDQWGLVKNKLSVDPRIQVEVTTHLQCGLSDSQVHEMTFRSVERRCIDIQ